jgi:hypothetical protein
MARVILLLAFAIGCQKPAVEVKHVTTFAVQSREIQILHSESVREEMERELVRRWIKLEYGRELSESKWKHKSNERASVELLKDYVSALRKRGLTEEQINKDIDELKRTRSVLFTPHGREPMNFSILDGQVTLEPWH